MDDELPWLFLFNGGRLPEEGEISKRMRLEFSYEMHDDAGSECPLMAISRETDSVTSDCAADTARVKTFLRATTPE